MVKSVEVKNFKSIVDLKLELGRVNVFIGENGSGKSNILEAVAFGAAASANKLDKEFLASRGMRVPEPKLMRSAFSKDNLDRNIDISFQIANKSDLVDRVNIEFVLRNDNKEFSEWIETYDAITSKMAVALKKFVLDEFSEEQSTKFLKIIEEDLKLGHAVKVFIQEKEKLVNDSSGKIKEQYELGYEGMKSNERIIESLLSKFKIYAPENTFLRKFEDEDVGDPLGIRGEGLFRLLRYFIRNEDKKYIEAIKEAMTALDWFEDFNIADDLSAGERKLRIIDRFLDPDVSISQNSANEGFLFILFYLSLFVSPDTPPFFAIDNLDASFNPKLCKQITRVLIKTAKGFDKQAIFTTHNPFILDGLDLTDDEQRLFVVYRTQKGHTIAKRVEANERKMSLSQQWMEGLLGGLPENF